MLIVIILLATFGGIYKDDIKSLHSYGLFMQVPKLAYELTTQDDKGDTLNKLEYKPHLSSFLGFSVGLKDIELSLSIQNEDESNSYARESDLFDVQLLGTFDNHLWEIYYQNYQGLYITNSIILDSELPKANSLSYGLNMKYFTSDSYIADSSIANFSHEKKTDWTYLIGLNINKAKLFSNKGLIPASYEANFSQLKGLKSISTTNIGISGGVTGMYLFEYGFYASGLFAYGYYHQTQNFSGIEQSERQLGVSGADIMMDLGYEWNKNTISVQARAISRTTPVKNATFNQTRSLAQVYYKYFF